MQCRKNVIYFYNDLTFYRFCKIEELNYKYAIRSIEYYMKKNKEVGKADIIKKVANIYLNLKKIKEHILIFKKINSNISSMNINEVCKKLSINRRCVYKVLKYGFSKNCAISMIYFLYDNESQMKGISNKQIKQIKNDIDTSKCNNELKYQFFNYYSDISKKQAVESIYYLCKERFKSAYFRASREIGIKINKDDVEEYMRDMFIDLSYSLEDCKAIRDNENDIGKKLYSIALSRAFITVKSIKNNLNIRSLDENIFGDKTLYDFL